MTEESFCLLFNTLDNLGWYNATKRCNLAKQWADSVSNSIYKTKIYKTAVRRSFNAWKNTWMKVRGNYICLFMYEGLLGIFVARQLHTHTTWLTMTVCFQVGISFFTCRKSGNPVCCHCFQRKSANKWLHVLHLPLSKSVAVSWTFKVKVAILFLTE